MPYPTDRKYTKEHEWIQVDGAAATVGITDYAQESLGDIVFVELPKVGAELAAGKTFGSVESVKAVSDLYAPASGTVTEVNADLANSLGNLLNRTLTLIDKNAGGLIPDAKPENDLREKANGLHVIIESHMRKA